MTLEIKIQEVLNKEKVYVEDNCKFMVCHNNGRPQIWQKGRLVFYDGDLQYTSSDTWVDQLTKAFHKHFVTQILND